ncbi:uncharacterized protein METZ01_LOCUS135779 [marine metagenome]|uniref:Uncharacterized protein n=1 Tax=marine metagenome TaxID=408172 RepID=A0A381Z101_9ZZZZ
MFVGNRRRTEPAKLFDYRQGRNACPKTITGY